MRKFYLNALALVALLCVSFGAKAVGWPSNYQGVMLQGFYWDSYSETSWAKLTEQADELSKYFKLIWVPNSAKSAGMPAMGYMPIYWFTNHNCAFGSEAQLKTMISTFKAKGVGMIEDVVVNHRAGVSNWYDFPSETWNGRTYHLTNGAICSSDEMWKDGGHGCPYTRGGNDTGEDFNGARDLDHTNATVQDNVKNYCKFLIDELGYVGFRLDMVKGYGGQYTKIYNQYSRPQFSVGEYWDGNYDAVAAWIEATGKESAAFDFPFKYAVNQAFDSGDMTKLVWKANGVTDQPAGLIHYGYPQFAVTFIDNHDTYRDGSKFNGNVVAANAFMLCSPGTPCVFWPHYTQNKAAIQALINVRNQVGVHNQSAVRVLQSSRDCYMAEVTGTNGKLVVKIGSAMVSPPGYTDSQIKCSGNGYCVWATTSGGVTPTPTGDPFTVYFKNTAGWNTPHIHYWGASESTWPGVAMSKVSGTDDVWSYTVPAGTTGLLFNAGDGDATKTQDFVAQANHIYTTSADEGVYGGGNGGNGGGNDNPGLNTSFNIYWDNSASQWATPYVHYWGGEESKWPGVAMAREAGDVWKYTVPAGTTGLVFNAGDGDATKTPDFVAQANHIYTAAGDQGVYNNANPTPDPGTYPDVLYLIGNVNGYEWATDQGIEAKGSNGVYVWPTVTIDDGNEGKGYFAFVTLLGPDWDTVNSSDRYGAPAANTPIALGQSADIKYYQVNVNASGSESWEIASGVYSIRADLGAMKVTVGNAGNGVGAVDASDEDAPVMYFNLQGVRVENPAPGAIYIRVQGSKAAKVVY